MNIKSILIEVQRDANYAVQFILLQNHSTCFGCHSTYHQEC